MRTILIMATRVTTVVKQRHRRRHVNSRFTASLPALVGAAFIVGACGDGGAANDEPSGATASPESASAEVSTVIATTTIWADVVANLACTDEVAIATVIPPGGDPHGYEPSIADRQAMDEADLIVANGLSLEEGLADILEAVEAGGTPVFHIADHVDTISYGADSDGVDEHGHSGDADPHIWLDPVRVADVLPELGDALTAATDLDPSAVAGCVTDYRQELAAVDSEIADLVSAIPVEDRKLVTNHDGFGYFADRYGFEVIGTVLPSSSTLAEANPAQLERLARSMGDAGVTVVFAETQHSTEEAEALAVLAGDVEVVTLLSGTLASPDDEADSGADTYIGLLRTNATRIAEALT